MRVFWLHRKFDGSGLTGTGIVAEGVEFSDGTIAIHWHRLGPRPMTVLWPSLDDLIALHGHDGTTRLVWQGDPALPIPSPAAEGSTSPGPVVHDDLSGIEGRPGRPVDDHAVVPTLAGESRAAAPAPPPLPHPRHGEPS